MSTEYGTQAFVQMRFHSLLSICTLTLLVGCDVHTPICPAVIKPAVVVEVRNAATGAPEAENADGRLIDGPYVDSMHVSRYNSDGVPIAMRGADERAGTYTVLIEKQGFQAWSRSGITVLRGECGVATERLEADLSPVQDK